MSPVVVYRHGKTIVRFVEGDISEHQVHAIVDPAHPKLLGGGVIDGAIHQKGGEAILHDCQRYRHNHGELSPGEAIVTTAGELEANIVIHAVGPIWHGGDAGEPAELKRCHINSLMLAEHHDAPVMAFPGISTGGYGYPVRRAAEVAVTTVADHLETRRGFFEEVRFVLPSKRKWEAYANVAQVRLGDRIA